MRIALVAGEASGDTLGAGLIDALRKQHPDIECFGVAGPKMQAAGCEAIESSEALSVMGIAEVLKEIPRLLRLRKRLVSEIAARKPDVVVGIDAPDFNIGLEKRLRSRGFKTVHYVSPSVWAWRQGRLKGIAQAVDCMLCLLPFEADFYRQSGVSVRFVGHHLADTMPMQPDRSAARKALGIAADAPVLALLPGSRGAEVGLLGPRFLAAFKQLKKNLPNLQAVAPMANAKVDRLFAQQADQLGVDVQRVDGQAARVLAAADAVLIASGTATLEALLSKRPMVVAYATNAFTSWLLLDVGLLKTPYVSLPNLLSEKPVTPELLQDVASPAMLAGAAHLLLTRPAYARQQVEQYAAIHHTLARGASQRAAQAVLDVANGAL